MFGFSIRTRQNATNSPSAVGTPKTAGLGSPKTTETPRSLSSPRADVGEIDTRAPFQSVKAAVSLFGEVASPKAAPPPVVKKFKTAEERVLEKETQLHLTLKELDYFKQLLRSADATKIQAQRELVKANRTLQELTGKLEIASESKQAAIAGTEAAKNRAKQLEEVAKTSKAQIDVDSWKQDVDSEREQYKASAAELIAAKQELTSIRQDFDKALEIKLTSFQEAADAQHATKVYKERFNELSKEIATMRETLSQVKVATRQAQEEQAKSISDKEACLQSHRTAMAEVETKILWLKEEEFEFELSGNLEEKLEETTEAIQVLREQLTNVRESDLESIRAVNSELEDAKNALETVLREERSLRSLVDSLQRELGEVRRDLLEMKRNEAQSESAAENLRVELETSKVELQEALAAERKRGNNCDDMCLTIQQLLSETENARREAEEKKKSTEELKQEAEIARNAAEEIEKELQVALKEAEEAKAMEKLASDQIHTSSCSDDAHARKSDSKDKIKLSVEDYKSLSRKAKDSENLAEEKVEEAMAEVEASNAREKETVKRLEESLKEMENIKAATEEALKKAEMDDTAKQVVEGELQKWRQHTQQNEVGETSNSREESEV
ncbi:hypothetical protein CsSME_00032814 [Camellia sinensis var. sinensis]